MIGDRMADQIYTSFNIDIEPSLMDYMPDIYKDVLEMEELLGAENEVFSNAFDSTVSLMNNQFIMSSDVDGISRYEKLFKITNKSGKTLEDRRYRVLLRLYTTEPFTLDYLNGLLNNIAAGSYAELDSASTLKNPILNINFNDNSESIWEDISHLIIRMSPLNTTLKFDFIYNHELDITETVSAIGTQFNYVLGKWKLGNEPFASTLAESIVNSKDIKTLNEYNLSNLIFEDVSTPVVFNGGEATLSLPEDISSSMGTTAWEVKYTLPEALDKITTIDIGDDSMVEVDTNLDIFGKVDILHTLKVKDRIQVI